MIINSEIDLLSSRASCGPHLTHAQALSRLCSTPQQHMNHMPFVYLQLQAAAQAAALDGSASSYHRCHVQLPTCLFMLCFVAAGLRQSAGGRAPMCTTTF